MSAVKVTFPFTVLSILSTLRLAIFGALGSTAFFFNVISALTKSIFFSSFLTMMKHWYLPSASVSGRSMCSWNVVFSTPTYLLSV